MSPSPKFWDRIAQKYSRQPIADQEGYERKLRETQAYFRPDWQALELGCGTGSTAIEHAPHVARYHAVDISENMLMIGREKAAAKGIDNITFEQSSVEGFHAPDGTYDAILTLSLLHLLEDLDGALARIHKMLSPGGIFVSSTVCLADSMAYLKLILPVGRAFGFFPYVRFLKKDDLITSVKDAGFKIETQWSHTKARVQFIIARKQA